MEETPTAKATITIAGKEFPLMLNEVEMGRLHLIEEEINNKVIQYQSQYEHINLKDAITLVLISYAFELKGAKANQSSEKLDQALNQLESILQVN